jgi:hypothetical protein
MFVFDPLNAGVLPEACTSRSKSIWEQRSSIYNGNIAE